MKSKPAKSIRHDSKKSVSTLTVVKPINRHMLKRLLNYKNPEIVAKFCKNMGVEKSIGNRVFKDMLMFFYLCKRHHYLTAQQRAGKVLKRTIPAKLSVIDPMLLIDEMWHTFILYTPDYIAFSQKYFGHYFGHAPTPVLGTKSQLKQEMITRNELQLIVSFVWDELGEGVVDRWFVDYHREYTRLRIRELQYLAAA